MDIFGNFWWTRQQKIIISTVYHHFKWGICRVLDGWWLVATTTILSTVTPEIGEHQDPEPDSWWCITGLMLQAKLSHHHICLLVGWNSLKPWMKPTPSAPQQSGSLSQAEFQWSPPMLCRKSSAHWGVLSSMSSYEAAQSWGCWKSIGFSTTAAPGGKTCGGWLNQKKNIKKTSIRMIVVCTCQPM